MSNPMLRFNCDFLPNPGNITPFVRWNKQKESAPHEMYFYVIESSKLYQRAHLSLVQFLSL